MNKYQEIQKILKKTPKTWLITGVAGFIGSNLLETLLKLDQHVVGLDNFSTGYKQNLNEVKSLVTSKQWSNFKLINGDIRNLETCQNACKKIDFILHQAALGSVPRSIKDPIQTNEVNINGFLNILLAGRDNSVKNIVYAASSSTYGDEKSLPKIEEKIGNPLSPYAVTKYVNELYAEVFVRAYGVNAVGLRYFNVFGKRQDPNGDYAAVIPKWISTLLNNEIVNINGDGETSRDFCYIENVIQANLLAAISENKVKIREEKRAKMSEVYNIALGKRTTLNQLYIKIKELLSQYDEKVKRAEPAYRDFREGDVRHSEANITKAKADIEYNPEHSLERGLSECIDWYVKNKK